MNERYNKQPTILIGLGGLGAKIVNDVYDTLKENQNISAFSIDTDVNELYSLTAIPKGHCINIAPHAPVASLLNLFDSTREWFPNHPLLQAKALSEDAGQIRAIARLAFECALSKNCFEPLLNCIHKIAQFCTDCNDGLRISITTSLGGGTGSGIFIQTALLIRKYVADHFPNLNLKIHGEFILPARLLFLPTKAERRYIEANTYASLKELHAINQHFFNNTPALKLRFDWKNDNISNDNIDFLPYDYCFLYDKATDGIHFDKTYVVDALLQRLFGKCANILNQAFVDGLRSSAKKCAGNMYGVIRAESIPTGAPLLTSKIYRDIVDRIDCGNGNSVMALASPKKTDVDTALLPTNSILLETTDATLENTTVIRLDYGMEISKIEKLRYETGQYYISYKNQTEKIPQGSLSPHLHKDWHLLENIEADTVEDIVIPQKRKPSTDSSIFISYSTKESVIAEQTRQVLETNGIRCWMAPQSIPAGSDYGMEIPGAINSCKALLLILSQASQNSNWVPKEVGLAIGKGKIVIPFQIDNAVISDSFNFYLTNSQRISAYNRLTEAYQELVNRILDILS